MAILAAVLTLGALGALFGAGLAFASRKLAVHTDLRLEKIMGLLPGANCGACGAAGCFGFAEAVLKGELPPDACRAGDESAKRGIAAILGKKLDKSSKRVAVPHCRGGANAAERYIYSGLKDCRAAAALLGGPKKCPSGCIGLGTCVTVCPFNAISMGKDGLPRVDKNKCRACGKCVSACPKRLFSLRTQEQKVSVACRSLDTAAVKRGYCKSACIACRRCEKTCRYGAVKVENNLAVIDYAKCTSCMECVEVCPVKAIAVL